MNRFLPKGFDAHYCVPRECGDERNAVAGAVGSAGVQLKKGSLCRGVFNPACPRS
ncbi:MAG TPA: hypothetical protein VJW95_02620 [Dissulfurispiraceae bacterium]|nr:hypothetical protein [Dissulfurispiraceae bacterium]